MVSQNSSVGDPNSGTLATIITECLDSQGVLDCNRHLNENYCCPSGFSELRPARRISSVDSRFTAITELDMAIRSQ